MVHTPCSLQTYGVKVDQIKADFGMTVSPSEVEKALGAKKYKIVTITHVDTSTGMLFWVIDPPPAVKIAPSRAVAS